MRTIEQTMADSERVGRLFRDVTAEREGRHAHVSQCLQRSFRRCEIVRAYPIALSARARATLRPMPRAGPVTSATRFYAPERLS